MALDDLSKELQEEDKVPSIHLRQIVLDAGISLFGRWSTRRVEYWLIV